MAAQQLRQLGDIGRDPQRLIFGEQLCCRTATPISFLYASAHLA
jgi:hypothetical protein